ncbi:hypothetical protein E4U41_000901 [Claviceps citrina]|nr:hypothetical protein E4U41_000901 [Claviceps citrina]
MSWKAKLKNLQSELEGIVKPRLGHAQQPHPPPPPPPPPPHPQHPQYPHEHHHSPHPPPPPMHTRPPAPASAPSPSFHTYWVPRFFPDAPLSAEWDAKLGNGPDGWGNQELQHYTAGPENAFHTPTGQLVIRALANSAAHDPHQRFTSARLVSRATLARDEGVLTAVLLSPCAEGIWPAFWLLPQEPFSWPTDGEVDIAETWNGDRENRSCLHWGHHHEKHKHRVLATKIPDMHARPVRYDFAWRQPGGVAGQGRMVWYIDGRAVMKAAVPEGTRPLRDMSVLLNVAMGGSVCAGKIPSDGHYDMVVHALFMASELEQGGWPRFEADWESQSTPHGNPY